MSNKVIIGIHGLNNKPDAAVLEKWWREAIDEGLRRNCPGENVDMDFELVYWASVMYDQPIAQGEEMEGYRPAAGEGPLPRPKDSAKNTIKTDTREGAAKVLEKIFGVEVADKVVDKALATKAPDVARYRADPEKREAVQDRLLRALERAGENGKDVMLVAHSMGSIIAYDVLANLTAGLPKVQVTRLVTIGSPLGLDEVKDIVKTNSTTLQVPDCVGSWTNFADPRDLVACLDSRLATDYSPNVRGVEVCDRPVINGYVNEAGEKNHHKIYGYLRTPEMSEEIVGFAGHLKS